MRAIVTFSRHYGAATVHAAEPVIGNSAEIVRFANEAHGEGSYPLITVENLTDFREIRETGYRGTLQLYAVGLEETGQLYGWASAAQRTEDYARWRK